MNKQRAIIQTGLALLTAALIATLTACGEAEPDTNARLASLKINDKTAQLGSPKTTPDEAEPRKDVEVTGTGFTVSAKAEAPGADVAWFLTSADDPDYEQEWGNEETFSFDDPGASGDYFLVIRVTSADGSVVWYYKAKIRFIYEDDDSQPPPKVNAVEPVFTIHPASAAYLLGETIAPLTVAATASDGGNVTYQWYYATDWTGTGTLEQGETGETYIPTDILAARSYYFYVVATNTNPAATGTIKIITQKSARARIEVFPADKVPVEQLVLQNGYAIYKFDLPDGETLGNYNAISAEYKLDSENAAKVGAAAFTLYGYQAADFSPEGSQYMAAPLDDAYILGAGAGTPTADDWFTVTYTISGAAAPYFGIGIPGDSDAITQLVKNVTLVHKTDVAHNVVSRSSGLAAMAFAADNANQCNRFWTTEDHYVPPTEPIPDYVMDLTSNPEKNASPVSAADTELFRIDLGENFDVTKYKTFTIELNVYEADGTTAISPDSWDGIVLMQWEYEEDKVCANRSAPPTDNGGGILNGHEWRWDLANIGPNQSANTDADIPAYLFEIDETLNLYDSPNPPSPGSISGHPGSYLIEPLRYLYFKSAANWPANARYLEVTKITFFANNAEDD